MLELEAKCTRFPIFTRFWGRTVLTIVAGIILLSVEPKAHAQSAGAPYPRMATIDQYLMTQDAEVALARTAGPESISKDADVLVLDRHGYRTAIKGRNGFVCVVERSWAAGPDEPEFWNPKMRAPVCYNAAAARSYLPLVIKRTNLVLAGKPKEQIPAEIKAAFEAKEIPAIEPGAMAYMLSKQGYLNDGAGHWHPHIMVFVPQSELPAWGANLPASPILGVSDQVNRVSVVLIPVRKWSDGSPDSSDGSH